MTDYREIIRLHSLKFSNVAIANSLCCSRNTVSEVLKLAETHSLEWPIPETLTNRDIGHLFYPGRGNNEGRRLPDYEYVYNELAKPGVTLSLLWAEYCAKCEAEHTIPYQHSQCLCCIKEGNSQNQAQTWGNNGGRLVMSRMS